MLIHEADEAKPGPWCLTLGDQLRISVKWGIGMVMEFLKSVSDLVKRVLEPMVGVFG